MDILVWLRDLGLGKYEAAFRENDIDETVLPSLTHETLKETWCVGTRRAPRQSLPRCVLTIREPVVVQFEIRVG